jgi:hypothetical protein
LGNKVVHYLAGTFNGLGLVAVRDKGAIKITAK